MDHAHRKGTPGKGTAQAASSGGRGCEAALGNAELAALLLEEAARVEGVSDEQLWMPTHPDEFKFAEDDTTVRLARPLLLEEPLQRAYRSHGWIRGRFNRRKALSIARLSLGRDGMTAMGLPVRALPWYPLFQFARNQVRQRALLRLPGGRGRLVRQGRREQEHVLSEVDPRPTGPR